MTTVLWLQHYDNIMLITLWWSERKYVKDSSPRLIESDAKSLASLAPRYPTIVIYIVICLSSALVFVHSIFHINPSIISILHNLIFFIFLSSQINSDHISSPALEQQVSQATAGNPPSQVRSQPTQVRSASIVVSWSWFRKSWSCWDFWLRQWCWCCKACVLIRRCWRYICLCVHYGRTFMVTNFTMLHKGKVHEIKK